LNGFIAKNQGTRMAQIVRVANYKLNDHQKTFRNHWSGETPITPLPDKKQFFISQRHQRINWGTSVLF
jgi:hypothetical protein